MGILGAIVRTAVNTAALPVEVVKDVLMVGGDASDGKDIGHRTAERIEQLKREADEEA